MKIHSPRHHPITTVVRTDSRSDATQPPETNGVRRKTHLNAGLTAAVGLTLILPIAAEVVTVIVQGGLLPLHVFLGLALVPLITLKVGTTTYRAMRYYTNDADYRESGPPVLWLRLLAPILVVATLLLFASGILLVTSNSSSLVSTTHLVAFWAFVIAVALHGAAHTARALKLTTERWRPAPLLENPAARWGIVLAAVIIGIAFALLLPHHIGEWGGD